MKLFGTAIILAGGKSERMGFDKAFIEIGGRPILELITDRLNKIFDDIVIVTNSPANFSGLNVRTTEDIIKGAGPLGGIHAGLIFSKSIYSFLTACDMPIVSTSYIEHMMGIALRSMPDAVISEKGDWVEPFHALYNKSLIRRIEQSIKEGRHGIFDALKGRDIIRISEEKVREYSPDLELFTNLNNAKDLDRFVKGFKPEEARDVLL